MNDAKYPPDELMARFGFSWDSVHSFGPYLNFWSFYELVVKAAPPGSTIVELGCFYGQSLICLGLYAKEANKGLKIVSIDANATPGGTAPTAEARESLKQAGLDIPIIEMDSAQAASQFADKSVWAVFVDSGHLHELVEADVRSWMPKICDGGWLTGHDFLMFTVHQPVLALFNDKVIYDERWDDIWIVPKCEPTSGIDVRTVPDKLPERTIWTP